MLDLGELAKKLSKKIISLLLILILMLSASVCAWAAPADSYTHIDSVDGSAKLRLSREMYVASQRINATSLGLTEPFDGLTDICTDSDGCLYVLCGDESRIYRVSPDYATATEMTVMGSDGEKVDIKGAKGVYCDNGLVYIADTGHARVLICDINGTVKDILLLPDSKLIESDFLYQPTSILRDENGYTYVLSLGCYYGALLYSPTNEFLGFYGSNAVETNALDFFSFLWDKLTSTNKKRSASIKKLPYSFVDFCFDSQGYMITCTGNTSTDNNGTGQIKKISPNGTDILYKRNPKGGSTVSSAVNFLENETVLREKRTGNPRVQNLICVTCTEDNYILGLDKTHGYIYMYDSECNMMSVFGGGYGTGNQLGVFESPVALCLNGNSVLVADSSKYSITVFEPTEYGLLFREAETLYLRGNYTEAAPLWLKVLEKDASNQLAHRGMAMFYYNNGDYKAAMESAKIACDYTVYDLAYSALLAKWFAENYLWVILISVLILATVIVLFVLVKKGKLKIKVNEKIRIMFGVSFHPFKNFEDIKYRKKGSAKLALLITFFLFLSFALKATCSGFLYSQTDMTKYNIWNTLIGTGGLLLLWSICNWLISSMFQGKGTFGEVYIASSYVMVPMIGYTLLYTVLSNFLPLSMFGVVTGIGTAITIFTVFLMTVALMTVHEFDFFKFALSVLVTAFFMILVIFVILMCAILMIQFVTFFKTVYTEVAYR